MIASSVHRPCVPFSRSTSGTGRILERICLSTALGLAVGLAGCSKEKPTSDPLMGVIVYVDLESQEPVVDLATAEVPAINPETGRRTLMPGLYCSQCERWHPAPAYDKLQRVPGAANCPTDGTPLTADGPWPTGDES